ncbi:MAG TPA: response regulator [Opitutales bacterium]|nr:response regulator [Opitutales bacterium]
MADSSVSPRIQPNSQQLGTPILIVDDVQDNIDLLVDLLTDAGYTSLQQATSGEAALKILKENPNFGLILLDLMMPGIDGCEVCSSITSHPETCHIPVIMVTGGMLDRDEALQRSFDAGALDFISKPLRQVELFGRIRAALTLYHQRIYSRDKTRALEQSEERFQLAVNGANDGIWDLNLLTGEAYLSLKWKEMLGFKVDEVENTIAAWESFIHPEDRERVTTALEKHWQDRTSIYMAEHRMITRTGDEIRVLSRGKTIWDEFGRTIRMAGSMTDITAQKRMETKLRHAQKLEVVSRFAGSVAHDFNNILSLISAYSQVILEEPRLTPTVRKYSQEIVHGTEQAAALMRQMLSLSRRSPAAPRPVNLNHLLAPMEKMLRRIVGRRIEYQQKLSPKVRLIEADKSMIEQLILNLAINARDAMFTGKLTIETFCQELSAEECADNEDATPGLVCGLRISDTGCGIADDVLSRIFEPFFTTKSEEKGTGLGLSSASAVVKQHNGWMTVKSEIDKGTTFTVYFPALKDCCPKPPPESLPPISGNGETILLVEDENSLREMTSMILTGYNYNVLPAASGPEAIEIWSKHSDEIAILFTDMVMPHGLTGIDLGNQFRKEKPSLKILYTSGYGLDSIQKSSAIEDSGKFIPKPYIPSKLAKLIREILDAPVSVAG